jgi:hypothetical protein
MLVKSELLDVDLVKYITVHINVCLKPNDLIAASSCRSDLGDLYVSYF